MNNINKLKKEFKVLLIFLVELIIIVSLLTLLYYFNITSLKTHNSLKIISLLTIIFINTYQLGFNGTNKGYLIGLKFSLYIILLFIPISLLINKTFKLKYLVYYLIISLTSILGSMIGISKKKK